MFWAGECSRWKVVPNERWVAYIKKLTRSGTRKAKRASESELGTIGTWKSELSTR